MTKTRATKTRTWSEFKRWCDARGLKALPANPWTVAAYLRWVDRRLGAMAARAALDTVAREHILKTLHVPAKHPTVKRTLDLIERRAEVRGQQAALFDEADVLSTEPQPKSQLKSQLKSKAKMKAVPAKPTGRRTMKNEPSLKRARPKVKVKGKSGSKS